jgi:hypothetical protein
MFMDIKKEFLAILLVLCSSVSYAYDWYANPSLALTERYIDNLRLQNPGSLPPIRGNFISTLSPTMTLGYIEDNHELNGGVTINQLLYHDQPSLDFTEVLANMNFSMQNTERWSSGFKASFGDQASLGTESVQLGVNGSGAVSIQLARYTTTLAPNIAYRIDEKNTLQLSANYMSTTYGPHPNQGLGYSPYDNLQATLSGIHAYSERLSLNVSASYSNYNTHNNVPSNCLFYGFVLRGGPIIPYTCQMAYQQTSNTYSTQAGFNYFFTENLSMNGSVGLRDSASVSNLNYTPYFVPSLPSDSVTNSTVNGKTYALGINQDLEKGNVNISASQQLNPASTGTQQQTTQVLASGRYNLTEQWSTGLNASYLITQSVSSVISPLVSNSAIFNRNLLSISPNLKWDWTPEMSFLLSYTYLDQKYTLSNQTATSNALQLQFVYQPSINRQVK